MPVTKSLVIVESPAKARTIAGFLGKNYIVESSIGHVRDLPKRAGDIPAEFKKQSWARLGVDVDNDFRPLYVVDADKKPHIAKLRKLLKEVDQLLLATDEDREGESIAWHLLEVLEPKVPVKRMVFHEITRKAIEHAIAHPREIHRSLVDAQEARRILDRLYGYEVSPVLWKKVMPRLSAGRVQSVATRIIVDREWARIRFRTAHYWDVLGRFKGGEQTREGFEATLSALRGARLASGRDFDESGKLTRQDVVWLDETRAQGLSERLESATFEVRSIERKPFRRSPAAPFMTSTLQQEAGRKLKFSAMRTMRAAQRLYENGFITYMRTDSTTLSDAALSAARQHIRELFGADYLPPGPRSYKNKVKNAQEAHEAIRPAGEVFRAVPEVESQLGGDEARLYELIWKRTIASQMPDATGHSVVMRLVCADAVEGDAEFSVSGTVITFPGFQRVYIEDTDEPNEEQGAAQALPNLKEGQKVPAQAMKAQSHQTQPPARFTEASLVRRLEELGVGRPSTYASILGTIQDRGYVWKKGSALVPSYTAFVVVSLLEQHFGGLVDYAFTAKMEDDLDAIARGDESSLPWLRRFYFGQGKDEAVNSNAVDMSAGLSYLVAERLEQIDAREINTIPIGKDEQGREIAIRVGRYGPYLQRDEDRASIPEDLPPDELTIEKALVLLAAPSGDRVLGNDPETDLPVFVKAGRFGSYVQLGEPEEGKKASKPKTATLLPAMSMETLTLEEALQLLSLPRTVGSDPQSGEVIQAHNGRFGPYLTRGKDNRSLPDPSQLFTVTLEQALALFAQPKTSRRRGEAAAPLKELGSDPVSGGTIVLRKGRFGLYVTDGETNASLRSGDDAENLSPERAQELLQERRSKAPTKKVTRRRGAAKAASNGAKKTAKKSTRKAPAKKKSAKAASSEADS